MACECCSGYFVLVHESGNVIYVKRNCTCSVLPVKFIGVVGVAEIARVQYVNIAVLEDLNVRIGVLCA